MANLEHKLSLDIDDFLNKIKVVKKHLASQNLQTSVDIEINEKDLEKPFMITRRYLDEEKRRFIEHRKFIDKTGLLATKTMKFDLDKDVEGKFAGITQELFNSKRVLKEILKEMDYAYASSSAKDRNSIEFLKSKKKEFEILKEKSLRPDSEGVSAFTKDSPEIKMIDSMTEKFNSKIVTTTFNQIKSSVQSAKLEFKDGDEALQGFMQDFIDLRNTLPSASKEFIAINKEIATLQKELTKRGTTSTTEDSFGANIKAMVTKYKAGLSSADEFLTFAESSKKQIDASKTSDKEIVLKVSLQKEFNNAIKAANSELSKQNELLTRQDIINVNNAKDLINNANTDKSRLEALTSIKKVYDDIINRLVLEEKETGSLVKTRKGYIDSYNKLNFTTQLNTIMNTYNSLDASERKSTKNIQDTIRDLTTLRDTLELTSNEYTTVQTKIKTLDNLLNKPTVAKQGLDDYNRGFTELISNFKKGKVAIEEYYSKLTSYRNSSDFKLTDDNEELLQRQLKSSEISMQRSQKQKYESDMLKSSIQEYTNIVKSSTKGTSEYASAVDALNRELSQQINILTSIIEQKENLNEATDIERRQLSDLITQRSRYSNAQLNSNISANAELEQMRRQYDISQKMNALTNGVLGSGDRRATLMDKFSNSLVYSISGAAYGYVQQSMTNLIKVNSDYESGLINITRVMNNLSQSEMPKIGQASIELSKKFGNNISDTQKAMADLAKAGINDPSTLKQMTESVLLGVNTTEIKDSAEMVKYLVSTVKQLGLQFSDSNRIIDEWNGLADRYAVSSKDFAEAISKAGASSKKLGLDLEDINSLVVLLGERTATSGNEIGNALKTLESYAYRPETIKALEKYGITIKKNETEFYGFKDIMSQVSVKLKEFGDESQASNDILDKLGGAWRKNWVSLLADSWDQLGKIRSEAKEIGANSLDPATSYSVIENAKIMETYAKKVEVLKVAFSELAISIGQSGLLDQLKTFVELMTNVANVLGSLPTPIKSVLMYAIELGLALQGLNLILKTFGISTLGNIFTSMAFNIQFATSAMFKQRTAMFGVAEAQRYVNAMYQNGVLTEVEYQAVLARTTALKRVDMATDRERIALSEAVAVGQLAANRSSAVGTFASKAGIIGTVAVVIWAVVEALGFFKEKSKEVNSELEQSLNTYKTYTSSLEDLTESYYNNKLVIQDAAVTKMEMTNIEKQLQQQLGITTGSLDFQNKSLKEQLDLIEKVKKAKEEDFLATAGKNIADAKETYNKKDAVSVGSVLTNKDPNASIEDAIISGITKDVQKYSGKKTDSFYDSISKIEKVRDILKEIDNVTVDQISGISFQGNKEEQLIALTSTVKALTEAYGSMDKKQKESFDWLNQLISDSSIKLVEFKSEYQSIIDVVKNYEKALKNLLESSKGDAFRNKYKVQFDFVEQRLKKMQTMKPYELKIEYANLMSYKDEWLNLLDTNKDGGIYFDLVNNFFNEIMSGSKKATEGMQYFNEQNDIAKRSVESFIKNEKDLANAYKEIEDTGHLSGQTISELVELYPQLSDKIKEQGEFLTIEKESLNEVFKADKEKTLAVISHRLQEVNAETDALYKILDLRGMDIESLGELEAARKESTKDNERLAKEYKASDNPIIRAVGDALEAELAVSKTTTDIYNHVLRIKQLKSQLDTIGKEDLAKYVKGLRGNKDDDGSRDSKSLSNKILEDARYQDLTSKLNNINELLAKEQALFDGLADNDYDKKIESLERENELLERKKVILSDIVTEEKVEQSELKNKLSDKGFAFDEEGVITNGTEKLQEYVDYVNARVGASDEEYNRANNDYTEVKNLFNRYTDLAKDISQTDIDFSGIVSGINKNLLEITDIEVAKKFDGVESSILVFEKALKDLDYELRIANKDKTKQYEILAQKSELYQNEIKRETSLLNELNSITDENITKNATFIKKKLELVDKIKEEIASLNDLKNQEIDANETALADAESRIIAIIDKGVELRKKALDKELDDFNDFIDEKIKARDKENDATDYEKDLKKELKIKQEIQDKINGYKYDTSLVGYQRTIELEEKLNEQNEKINDMKTKRNRDLIKQGLEDQKDSKAKEKENAINALDEEFSESNKRLIAHDILIDQSFDKIRLKFPELFKELDVATSDFFGTFESYELKFGNVVGDFAKKFKDEILPDLLRAVQALRDIESGINNIDYSQAEFNKDFDYSAKINEYKAQGLTEDSPEIVELRKKQAAKIYSDPKLTALYEQFIPEKYRQSKITTGINQANVELDKAEINAPKPTKYTKRDYERMYFDSSIDYSQMLRDAYNQGYTENDPMVVAIQEKRAAKIYSNENWKRLYENTIPAQYKISGSYANGINGGLINKTGTYLLHGSSNDPEWVLTNSQMYNLVRNMSNNMTSVLGNKGTNLGDINLSINIQGNATNDVVSQIKGASVQVISDMRRELNKVGIYK